MGQSRGQLHHRPGVIRLTTPETRRTNCFHVVHASPPAEYVDRVIRQWDRVMRQWDRVMRQWDRVIRQWDRVIRQWLDRHDHDRPAALANEVV